MSLPPVEFAFRSPNGEPITASQWLASWSTRFDTRKFPESVYCELVDKGPALTDDDIDVLGAWKDGACRTVLASDTLGNRVFGKVFVHFTGTWSSTAASCAFEAWKRLPQHRSALTDYLNQKQPLEFLDCISRLFYEKASRSGPVRASFGLSRATYVLHVFSRGEFPIYDSNTHHGVRLLTEGSYRGRPVSKRKRDDPRWYLTDFCAIIQDLQEQCGAIDLRAQRSLDKALFCYGKFFQLA